MIEIRTSLGVARIVQSVEELPTFPNGFKFLYADAETTSLNEYDDEALHPYLGDRACGWAVTVDDVEGAWYIPIRHRDTDWNLPLEPVLAWLRDLISRAYEWRNANIKFDAHVAFVDGVSFGDCRLGCTTTRAKLLDSDRFSHGLKPLTRDWLGIATPQVDKVQAFLNGIPMPGRKECKDYGRVPADILGEYACFDVLSNRRLEQHILKRLPAEQAQLLETETLLTPVLWDMENKGLKVDLDLCKREEYRTTKAMFEAQQLVFDRLGRELIDSNKCMQDLLLHQLGLPILEWGKKKKDGTRSPSFDKKVMAMYRTHPLVVTDPKIRDIVEAIVTYRAESRFQSLYVHSFQQKVDANGFIHPHINQCVRTGRMSSSDPNSQQLNKRAKALIVPDSPDMGILSNDASQAEFRMIAHITKDKDAIEAFHTNPKTDYHIWVAELCHIARQPAKTMNFLMAFGGGKRKATTQLKSLSEVLDEVVPEIDALIEAGKLDPDKRPQAVDAACARRASEIYETYHLALPGIKGCSKRCEKLTKERGYIRNPYKRRRHLSGRFAYKAFNAAVQGGVMDYVKERLVATSPRHSDYYRERDLYARANVHDEVMNMASIEVLEDMSVRDTLRIDLETPSIPFRVPFVWDQGYSAKSWKEAVLDADKKEAKEPQAA